MCRLGPIVLQPIDVAWGLGGLNMVTDTIHKQLKAVELARRVEHGSKVGVEDTELLWVA